MDLKMLVLSALHCCTINKLDKLNTEDGFSFYFDNLIAISGK